jgi:hypothetical protein
VQRWSPDRVYHYLFPTDKFSVGGDYVVILALPTKIGLTNRKGKTFAVWQFNDGDHPPLCPFRGKAYRIGAFLIASRSSTCFVAIDSPRRNQSLFLSRARNSRASDD